ncbi:MAG: GNAT family N-acetyltransferase [Planctomycetota bacterium]|nr:GNAT family N-acetyltransferase [Planctomycetota bacterium]
MSPSSSIREFLDWDSRFFGARIGRLNGGCLSQEILAQTMQWSRENRIDCLYFLADSDDQSTIRIAESAGFRLTDVRVTLELAKPDGYRPGMPPETRRFRPDDLSALAAIAKQSHRDSRFYQDGRFDERRCDELYATWIERSCQGWAQSVWVYEKDAAAVGYTTCHRDSDTEGSIGLVGVDPRAQGIGAGRALIESAKADLFSSGIRTIKVVTQGRNVRAQRLYQRAGFVTSSVQLWFHHWLDRD